MPVYCYGLVFQKHMGSSVNIDLRHGLLVAESEEQALGEAIKRNWPDEKGHSLTNKSIFEAKGYQFKEQEADEH